VRQGLGLIYSAGMLALLGWLLFGCAAARPTSLIRMRGGYELLAAHCEAWAESCVPMRMTGDPRDEQAWGFRARPVNAAGSLWKESEVFYAVGNRTRCDEIRAALGTPSEACWGPVYFRRE
jgi:hypothetical protein